MNDRKFLKLKCAGTLAQCGNCRNSLSYFFRKNFVKATVLLKKLLNSWFDEKNFQWERIFRFSTLWCGNDRNLLSLFFGKSFVKVMVLLTKLLKSWFDEKNFGESKMIFPQCDFVIFTLMSRCITISRNFLFCFKKFVKWEL